MIGDPLWWLEKLSAELSTRQTQMRLMDSYYEGDHPLPFLTRAHDSKMRNEFLTLLKDSRSNFMRLVVDVVEERLRVEGFRLSAATDAQADQRSWDIWQANQMDSESQSALMEALVKGVSYLSVWPGEPYPTIAVEDPLQTIVGYEPGSNYRRRAAALKIWRDDWTGTERANVYLPNGIYKFEAAVAEDEWEVTAAGPQNRFGISSMFGSKRVSDNEPLSRWKELPDEFVGNEFGEVPIVPLRNRPRPLMEGQSEIADVFQIQNQINGFLFLLALSGYFGAHKQRWATGMPMMEDSQGKPIVPLAGADTIWATDNPNTKFGEFSQTDLAGYISAIEQKILHIAVTTRTPRHYLIEQGQSPSGDAIKSAESGLVKKAERKKRPFGEGLEEAIRLARRFAGEEDAPVDSEIVWADSEIRTEAEITDAAIKKLQVGLITRQQALEDVGYSQTQIARMLAEPAPEPITNGVPTTVQ